MNGAHLDVAGGEADRPGLGPDFQPQLGYVGLIALVGADVDYAGEDAERVGPEVFKRRFDRSSFYGAVGFVDRIGAVSIATFLAQAAEQMRRTRFDQGHSGAQSDAGAPRTILNKDVDASGKRSCRRYDEAITVLIPLLDNEPDQRCKTADGTK